MNAASEQTSQQQGESQAGDSRHDETPSNGGGDGPHTNSGGGGKRPPPSSSHRVGKDGAPLSEKKLRRLEKNRLSARECRRRKKEATEVMERQINLLEGENLRLRLQLQIGEEAEDSMHQEQQKLTEGLEDLLTSGASESEIYAKIEEYKEKFADYGRDRRSAIEFHLRNVERLLKPTQTTSVVLATLQGGGAAAAVQAAGPPGGNASMEDATVTAAEGAASTNASVSDAGECEATSGIGPSHEAGNQSNAPEGAAPPSTSSTLPLAAPISGFVPAPVGSTTAPPSSSSAPPQDTKALFRHLVSILQVTPGQAAALKDSRMVAQEMDEILQETVSVLTELRSRLTQCGEDLDAEFNNVRAILTPSQSAKFLVWVAQNKACMHMLNELWSKVYPDGAAANDGVSLSQGEVSP